MDVLVVPSRRVAWTTYAYLALFVYLEYAVGVAVPYLRADLGLSDFLTGLHGTALGIGALVASGTVGFVAHAVGGRRLLAASWITLSAGAAFVGLAPLFVFSITGALLVGVGGGALATEANVTLAGRGDAVGRRHLGRGNAWAMAGGLAAPPLLAAAAESGTWRLAMLLPIAGFVIVSAFRSGPEVVPPASGTRSEPLLRDFWIAATFLALAVAIEWSIVFWGSTIVISRTGAATSAATLLAVFFMAGMLTGRTLVGLGAANRSVRAALTVALGVAAVGVATTWVSTAAPLSGVGLFLAGLGTGALYPLGVVTGLRFAAGRELAAAARLTFVSSAAIIAAPSLLGLLSDRLGVVGAWPVILVFVAAGVAALYSLPGEAREAPVRAENAP